MIRLCGGQNVFAQLAPLVPAIGEIELAGVPRLSSSHFVSGLKHLPIRYTLRA